MSVAGAEAQTAPEVPRLVVNVVIDQLRTDYMEAFSPLYSERGFMRLLKQGRVYTQAEYPFANPDRASAIACFMSGTSPYENGIVGERWLDRQTLTPVYCVDDKEFQGQHTTVASSPQHLGVSTITDELKVATEGNGLVYAIAPTRDAAVLMAGHAGDGAFWFNEETGDWCSTSYYGAFPEWAAAYTQRILEGKHSRPGSHPDFAEEDRQPGEKAEICPHCRYQRQGLYRGDDRIYPAKSRL